MSRFVIYGGPGPAAHALVIGVGDYPFLHGGDNPAGENWGLGQITSSPVSAARFADWFRADYHNPEKPAGTLHTAISQGGRFGYDQAEDPTLEAIIKNFDAWFEDADRHPENIAMLYFCGHGLESGALLSLLAADFGGNSRSPLRKAIDFDGLVDGMEKCAARHQLFLIDACRNKPAGLLNSDYRGDPLIDASPDDVHEQPRNYPIFYATAHQQAAWGLPGQPTLFTGALLRALNGLGANGDANRWVVDTGLLGRAVAKLLKWDRYWDPTIAPQEAKVGGQDSGFELHCLNAPPEIPVRIGCEPRSANVSARFDVAANGAVLQSRPPDPEDWRVDLPASIYEFRFQDGASPPQTIQQYTFPPVSNVIFRP